jgi:hypothetical protein
VPVVAVVPVVTLEVLGVSVAVLEILGVSVVVVGASGAASQLAYIL